MKEPDFRPAVLAEILAPLAPVLAEGLLLRPCPDPKAAPEELAPLCRELMKTRAEALPALAEILEELRVCPDDDLDDVAEELPAPALDLVNVARKIWETPLPPEAEGVRPLLATLAEAAPVALLSFLHALTQDALDPWGEEAENDEEEPSLPPFPPFTVDDSLPLRALRQWAEAHPGVLPADFFAAGE